MAVDSTGKIFTMADSNTETLGELLRQLGTILGVGPRPDGRYYLSDMFVGSKINDFALYKPFNNPSKVFNSDAEREEARELAGYGTVMSFTVCPDRYTLYIGTRRPFNAVDVNEPRRIRDFDGYDHAAQDGIAVIANNANTNNTSLVPYFHNRTSRNIALEHVGAFVSNPIRYDLVLYDSGWHELAAYSYTSIDDLRKDIVGGLSFNLRNYLSREPIGYDWTLGLVVSNSFASYMMPNPLVIKDNRTKPAAHPRTKINKFTPNMSIGTLTSGQNRLLYWMGGTLDTSKRMWYASNDLLLLGFSVTNSSTSPFHLVDLRLKLYTSESDYLLTNICVWNSSTVFETVPALATRGPQTYSDFPLYYVDLSGFVNWLKPSANAIYNVSFQLVWVLNANLTVPASPQIRFPIFFTGGVLRDPETPNPDVKPVPPSWDDHIVIM